jgi:hypothetical protein
MNRPSELRVGAGRGAVGFLIRMPSDNLQHESLFEAVTYKISFDNSYLRKTIIIFLNLI